MLPLQSHGALLTGLCICGIAILLARFDILSMPGAAVTTKWSTSRQRAPPEIQEFPQLLDPYRHHNIVDERDRHLNRSEFRCRCDVSPYCTPSTGGLWAMDDPLDLQLEFLGLSTTEATPGESDPDQNDVYCQRLEWIGARFYKHFDLYWWTRMVMVEPKYYTPDSYYAWPGAMPEDGVWAIWLWEREARKLNGGQINDAKTMQERSEVIQRLGGRFYSDWDSLQKEIYTVSDETRRFLDDPELKHEGPGYKE